MSDYVDELEAMRLRVTSPDGGVSAELAGRDQLRITFSGSHYYRTTERDLESALEALGRLLVVARTREVAVITERAGGMIIDADGARDDAESAYFDGLARITAHGGSEIVRVTGSGGMRQWTVRIDDGTLARVPEEEFTAALASAVGELIQDQARQVASLRHQVYSGDEW